MYLIKKQTLKILKSELVGKIENINHAFTTRIGGLSPAPYNSLNLYSILENEKENAFNNREILADILGFNSEKLVLA